VCYAAHPRVQRASWLVAGGRQAFVLAFVMAGEGGGSVMWLRVEDEDIDEAMHLRVTVSAVEEGKRKKKSQRYQCKVILHGSSKKEPVAGFKRFA